MTATDRPQGVVLSVLGVNGLYGSSPATETHRVYHFHFNKPGVSTESPARGEDFIDLRPKEMRDLRPTSPMWDVRPAELVSTRPTQMADLQAQPLQYFPPAELELTKVPRRTYDWVEPMKLQEDLRPQEMQNVRPAQLADIQTTPLQDIKAAEVSRQAPQSASIEDVTPKMIMDMAPAVLGITQVPSHQFHFVDPVKPQESLKPKQLKDVRPSQLADVKPQPLTSLNVSQMETRPPQATAVEDVTPKMIQDLAPAVLGITQVQSHQFHFVDPVKPQESLKPKDLKDVRPSELADVKPQPLTNLNVAQMETRAPQATTVEDVTPKMIMDMAPAVLGITQVPSHQFHFVDPVKPQESLKPKQLKDVRPSQLADVKPQPLTSLNVAQMETRPPQGTTVEDVTPKMIMDMAPAVLGITQVQSHQFHFVDPVKPQESLKPKDLKDVRPSELADVKPQPLTNLNVAQMETRPPQATAVEDVTPKMIQDLAPAVLGITQVQSHQFHFVDPVKPQESLKPKQPKDVRPSQLADVKPRPLTNLNVAQMETRPPQGTTVEDVTPKMIMDMAPAVLGITQVQSHQFHFVDPVKPQESLKPKDLKDVRPSELADVKPQPLINLNVAQMETRPPQATAVEDVTPKMIQDLAPAVLGITQVQSHQFHFVDPVKPQESLKPKQLKDVRPSQLADVKPRPLTNLNVAQMETRPPQGTTVEDVTPKMIMDMAPAVLGITQVQSHQFHFVDPVKPQESLKPKQLKDVRPSQLADVKPRPLTNLNVAQMETRPPQATTVEDVTPKMIREYANPVLGITQVQSRQFHYVDPVKPQERLKPKPLKDVSPKELADIAAAPMMDLAVARIANQPPKSTEVEEVTPKMIREYAHPVLGITQVQSRQFHYIDPVKPQESLKPKPLKDVSPRELTDVAASPMVDLDVTRIANQPPKSTEVEEVTPKMIREYTNPVLGITQVQSRQFHYIDPVKPQESLKPKPLKDVSPRELTDVAASPMVDLDVTRIANQPPKSTEVEEVTPKMIREYTNPVLGITQVQRRQLHEVETIKPLQGLNTLKPIDVRPRPLADTETMKLAEIKLQETANFSQVALADLTPKDLANLGLFMKVPTSFEPASPVMNIKPHGKEILDRFQVNPPEFKNYNNNDSILSADNFPRPRRVTQVINTTVREPMSHYHVHYQAVPIQQVPAPRDRSVSFPDKTDTIVVNVIDNS